MSSLVIDWQGEYAFYDKREDWLPEREKRRISPWILGQKIFANHNQGRFRTHATEEVVTAGSTVQLTAVFVKVEPAAEGNLEEGLPKPMIYSARLRTAVQ